MSQVSVYGRALCESCEALTNYLDFKDIFYQYYNVDYMDYTELSRVIMSRRNKDNRTLPIIFVDGRELEGNDEIRKFFERTERTAAPELGSSVIREERQDTTYVSSDNGSNQNSRRQAS